MTPMQEIDVLCPCCGRRFVLTLSDEAMDVSAPDQAQAVRCAAELGVELGVWRGGEVIDT